MEDEQIKQYAKRTLSLKNIDDNAENLSLCIDSLHEAFNNCYYSVCLDVDGTICREGENEVSDEIIYALTSLVRAGVNICFITGRGRSVKLILKSLILTIMEQNKDISFNMFRKWYCIIHNGVSLLSTVGHDINDFLTYDNLLISNEYIDQYETEVNNKIDELFKKNHDFLNLKETDYIIQHEKAGTRIVLYNSDIDENYINDIKAYLEIIKEELKTSLNLRVLQSRYKGKTVFEYAICNKEQAIANLEKFLGIPKSSMLRIGDQGQVGGNDYEMLNCQQGFSVKELSDNPCGCFPFLNLNNYNIEEGPQAAAHLLEYFTVAPAICLEKPNIERYRMNLASIEKRAAVKSNEYLHRYSSILSIWTSDIDVNQSNILNIHNIFDLQSGAVKFKNYEWELIPYDNAFKQLFTQVCTEKNDCAHPNLLYALMTDTSVILRGPYNYYYGLSFRKNKGKSMLENELLDLYINWIEEFKTFLEKTKRVLNIVTPTSVFREEHNRKFLFGIMDSVRNMLLTLFNALIELEAGNRIFVWQLEEDSCGSTRMIYDLLSKHTFFMYKLLFGGLYPFDFKEYVDLFENIKNFFDSDEMDKILLNFCEKCPSKNLFRVWREIDVFVENVIAIDIAFSEFNSSIENFSDRKIVVHGIRYGSIELPIICQVIGDLMGFKVIPSFVGLPGKYSEKHNSLTNYIEAYGSAEINQAFCDKNNINFIADDNLMSGRTVQIIINDLARFKCYPDGIIIVRYPSVNRIPHMLIENHGCPNVDLFFNLVKGLVSSTPYSRLFFPREQRDEKYLDETDVFNKCRQRISRYLFKNGIFSKDSEVIKDNSAHLKGD